MKILVDKLPKREFECLFGQNHGTWYVCTLPIENDMYCYIEHGVACPYLVELKEDDICELGCEGEGKANS